MKKLAILSILLVLLITPTVIFASDISDAKYYGLINISNNSTLAPSVSTNCSINTQNLIDGGYINSSANNCVIHNTSGSDVPFMPSVNSSYPWAMWVPSIGADSYLSYLLYTNATDGETRYFPGSGGMTAADNATIELGDNFTIEQKGWVDTTGGLDKYLANKTGAFGTLINGDTNILSTLGANQTEYLIPNALGDLEGITNATAGDNYQNVDDPIGAPDDATTSLWTSTSANETDFYNIANTALTASDSVDNVTVFFRVKDNSTNSYATPLLLLDSVNTTGTRIALTDGIWESHTETLDRPGGGSWTFADLDDLQVGITLQYTPPGNSAFATQVYAIVSYRSGVAATGFPSGEYTVTTSANVTHLWIEIDGSVEDTVALGGASAPDNSANWTFLQNDVMPYMEHHKIWVDGVLQQHIEWEYDTTFTDLSGNSHDATPTFRTTSSDADVSAELVLFQPVEEAQAPAFSLATPGGTIVTENLTTTGNFTTVPGPTGFPGKSLIEAVASASSTPAQLPFTVLAGFIIIGISLSLTYFLGQHGSGSLFIKIAIIVTLMGICIALGMMDFWMLIFFILISIALAFASRQGYI